MDEIRQILLAGEVRSFGKMGYVVKDGYVYFNLTPMDYDHSAILIDKSGYSLRRYPVSHTFEEIVEYVQEHKLEKCIIRADNISFIDSCPSLRFFDIEELRNADFDYSPLYRKSNIEYLGCSSEYSESGLAYHNKPLKTPVDFSKFSTIKRIAVYGKATKNLFANATTEEISTSENRTYANFLDAKTKNLLRFESICGGLKTLDGIGNFPKLERLNLYYQYGLKDISALAEVAGTLKQLIIEGCGRIKDYSVLEKMHNLEILHLNGSGKIDSIEFVDRMPNLKTFRLMMNCVNGNLTPCKGIPYVQIKNRKHYNMKQEDFPDDMSVPLPKVWGFRV